MIAQWTNAAMAILALRNITVESLSWIGRFDIQQGAEQ
jgi:hypothetical protein